MAQAVDHAVERLERQGLALVAPPAQDERRRRGRSAGLQVVEEGLDQAGLANPGAALHQHHRLAALASLGIGPEERLQLALAAGQTQRHRAQGACDGARALAPAGRPPRRGGRGSPARSGARARRARASACRARSASSSASGLICTGDGGSSVCLRKQHIEHRAFERAAPGQDLVDHRSHRVPVRGRQTRPVQRLLRRHVGRASPRRRRPRGWRCRPAATGRSPGSPRVRFPSRARWSA